MESENETQIPADLSTNPQKCYAAKKETGSLNENWAIVTDFSVSIVAL